MESSELVKNIMRAAYRVIPHILTEDIPLECIRQISIKTSDSPSLPFYSHLSSAEIKAYKKSKAPSGQEKKKSKK